MHPLSQGLGRGREDHLQARRPAIMSPTAGRDSLAERISVLATIPLRCTEIVPL